tara:strand:- start:119 stop:589 length:471 start_codon:yes stop_codon:yes gene_type:complete
VKSYVLVLLTAFCLLLASCEKPDFRDSNGRGHSYDDLAGQWVLVNYWATWCGPCRHEIPEFNQLAADYSDTIKVFGVNFEPVDSETMQEHVKEMGIRFPVYLDNDPYLHFGYERPLVLPTTIVISPAGEVHQVLVGPQNRESLLAATDLNFAEQGQ